MCSRLLARRSPTSALCLISAWLEVAKIHQKNLADELLQRLIKDELKTKFKTSVVKQQRFSELPMASLNKSPTLLSWRHR